MLGAHIIISSDGHHSVSSNTFPPTSTTTSVTDSPRCCSKDIEPLEVLEFTLLSSGCQFLTVGAPVKPPWPRFSSRGNTSSPYYCFPMSWEEGLLFSGISIYKYAAGLNKQRFGENGFLSPASSSPLQQVQDQRGASFHFFFSKFDSLRPGSASNFH